MSKNAKCAPKGLYGWPLDHGRMEHRGKLSHGVGRFPAITRRGQLFCSSIRRLPGCTALQLTQRQQGQAIMG